MNTPAADRDYAQGAIMLLQLSGNKIMYSRIAANPAKNADFIEYQLQKYLDFRIRKLTHDQVESMQKEVDKIVDENVSLSVKAKQGNKGRREDHDSLPEEIRNLYADNLQLLYKMRDLHLKLRSLSLESATCPDSERYPFLKEIISIDKKMRSNWKKYDSYEA